MRCRKPVLAARELGYEVKYVRRGHAGAHPGPLHHALHDRVGALGAMAVLGLGTAGRSSDGRGVGCVPDRGSGHAADLGRDGAVVQMGRGLRASGVQGVVACCGAADCTARYIGAVHVMTSHSSAAQGRRVVSVVE